MDSVFGDDEMEKVQYAAHSRQLDDLIRRVEDPIGDFTANIVIKRNLPEVGRRIQTARETFESFREHIPDFYKEFNRDEHPDWEAAWEETRWSA